MSWYLEECRRPHAGCSCAVRGHAGRLRPGAPRRGVGRRCEGSAAPRLLHRLNRVSALLTTLVHAQPAAPAQAAAALLPWLAGVLRGAHRPAGCEGGQGGPKGQAGAVGAHPCRLAASAWQFAAQWRSGFQLCVAVDRRPASPSMPSSSRVRRLCAGLQVRENADGFFVDGLQSFPVTSAAQVGRSCCQAGQYCCQASCAASRLAIRNKTPPACLLAVRRPTHPCAFALCRRCSCWWPARSGGTPARRR